MVLLQVSNPHQHSVSRCYYSHFADEEKEDVCKEPSKDHKTRIHTHSFERTIKSEYCIKEASLHNCFTSVKGYTWNYEQSLPLDDESVLGTII